MKLSILMPVYNEKNSVGDIVRKVLHQKVAGIDQTELIIVDDASTDGTVEVIRELAKSHPMQVCAFYHSRNSGKGAAIHTAIEKMTGDVCIIQDADMEYDPADYGLVLEPIINGRADCVYGSRFVGSEAKRVLFFWHYLGNRFLTFLSNMFTNLNFSDIETCYKAFRCDILKSIPLECQRFGFEPEITSKIAKTKCRVYEVGIRYQGRTYGEGKKITWVDGFKAIATIIRFH